MYTLRKKFDFGIVFTNTFFDDDSFTYIKSDYVHPEYDEDVLQKLMDVQIANKENEITKQAFCIFDDCLDDPKQVTSSVLKRLTTQLRHYNITVIMSTQYPQSLPSRMRANAMSVLFNSNNHNALKCLYESFGQAFPKFDDFKQYLFTNTIDHQFIYYNKMKPTELTMILKL
jgi:hypothetical protein